MIQQWKKMRTTRKKGILPEVGKAESKICFPLMSIMLMYRQMAKAGKQTSRCPNMMDLGGSIFLTSYTIQPPPPPPRRHLLLSFPLLVLLFQNYAISIDKAILLYISYNTYLVNLNNIFLHLHSKLLVKLL